MTKDEILALKNDFRKAQDALVEASSKWREAVEFQEWREAMDSRMANSEKMLDLLSSIVTLLSEAEAFRVQRVSMKQVK